MPISHLGLNLRRLHSPLPMFRGTVDRDQWPAAARSIAQAKGRLLALWGSDRRDDAGGAMVICAAYAIERGLLWLELPLATPAAGYPDLAGWFPCAESMQWAWAGQHGSASGRGRG